MSKPEGGDKMTPPTDSGSVKFNSHPTENRKTTAAPQSKKGQIAGSK
jgi:hypothetical protein